VREVLDFLGFARTRRYLRKAGIVAVGDIVVYVQAGHVAVLLIVVDILVVCLDFIRGAVIAVREVDAQGRAVSVDRVAVCVQRLQLITLWLDLLKSQRRIDGPEHSRVVGHVERRYLRAIPVAVDVTVNGRFSGQPHSSFACDGVIQYVLVLLDDHFYAGSSCCLAVTADSFEPDYVRAEPAELHLE